MRPLLITPFLMLLLMLLAPVLVRLGIVPPIAAFGAAAGGWIVGAGAGLIAGLIGIFKPDTRPLAWVAFAVGLVLAAALLFMTSRLERVPIHDVSTDLDAPPQFTVAAEHPDNAGRDLGYPHGRADTPALQRQHYPGLETLVVCDAAPDTVWAAALSTATGMGWDVTWSNAELGVIEAEAATGIFRFVDDVVVRLMPGTDGCTRVDVRSLSRVGRSDLGANAARVRSYLGELGSALAR